MRDHLQTTVSFRYMAPHHPFLTLPSRLPKHPPQHLPLSAALHQPTKGTTLARVQLARAAELAHGALGQHEHLVEVGNGAQAVCDDEQGGGAAEVGAQAVLDARVRGRVDGRRSLVEHEQARPLRQGPRQAEQLPLAGREVESGLVDGRGEGEGRRGGGAAGRCGGSRGASGGVRR